MEAGNLRVRHMTVTVFVEWLSIVDASKCLRIVTKLLMARNTRVCGRAWGEPLSELSVVEGVGNAAY